MMSASGKIILLYANLNKRKQRHCVVLTYLPKARISSVALRQQVRQQDKL